MSQQSFGRFVQRLTLVLMVGFGTLFVGVTHGDAIPALEAGAPTMYDYWFPRQAAVRQNLFAVYEEDAFSDEFADEMMRENIPMIANALVNAPTGWTYAKVEGVAGLLKFESADPFYDFATDWARWRGKGGKVMPTAILARLERAIPVLGERGYSTFIQFMAYALYCEILANDGQDAASLAAGKRAAELMIEALVEAPADDEFLQRWLNARLLEPIKTQWPDAASAQLVGMLEKAEGINPWHYEMAAGRYFLKRGWDARGTGFASTVSNQGSRDFRSDSIEAGKHLERAHDLEPTYPGAAAMMISVVMGVGSASSRSPGLSLPSASGSSPLSDKSVVGVPLSRH